MGLFSRLFEKRVNLSNPQTPITGGTLALAVGGDNSVAGTQFGVINADIALQFSAYYAGVRIIAESLAAAPLILYRRTPNGKERATDHPLYSILHDRPNDLMTSFTWRELIIQAAINNGNHFSFIERDGAYRPVNLLPMDPREIEIGILNGRKVYKRRSTINVPGLGPKEKIDYLTDDDVLHIMGATLDGLQGVSVIRYARNALGLGLAQEHHGMQFFAQGSSPSGILSTPGKLSLDARQRIKQSWESAYGGIKGAHRVPVLEEGLSFTPVTISNEDSQWLMSRKFQVEEIARWLRVPLHKLQSLDKATFSNIEHQALEFVQDTIRPWAEKIEQETQRKLLAPDEQQDYFVEFLLDGILRGDLKTRYEAYAIGRQWGWLSADDIRETENLNKLADGSGNVYLTPLNMVDSDTLDDPQDAQTTPTAATDQQDETDEGGGRTLARIIDAGAITIEAALSRMERKETEARKRPSFDREEFYPKHEAVLEAAILPPLLALAGTIAAVRNIDVQLAEAAARDTARNIARAYCAPDDTRPDAKAIAAQLATLIGGKHGN